MGPIKSDLCCAMYIAESHFAMRCIFTAIFVLAADIHDVGMQASLRVRCRDVVNLVLLDNQRVPKENLASDVASKQHLMTHQMSIFVCVFFPLCKGAYDAASKGTPEL